MSIMKYRKFYFAFSLILMAISIISLLTQGLRPSIDFVGGSLLEVRSPVLAELTSVEIIELGSEVMALSSVQKTSDAGLIMRGEVVNNERGQELIELLRQSDPSLEQLRFETIGPTFGREVLIKMMTAVVLVTTMIMGYIWYQFRDLKYGLCAVGAMIHDSLVVLGTFSVLGYLIGIEVDILFVTAILTTLAFSIHDTIVVFDRIRELSAKNSKYDYAHIVDMAVLSTVGRSVNNSVTVLLMLLALTLLGGDTIRWFVFALLVGVATGTYSSPFLAAPLLIEWDNFQKRRRF